MATEQTRDPGTGKFVPTTDDVDPAADGKAMDQKRGSDDAGVGHTEENNPRLAAMKRAREVRAKEMGAEISDEPIEGVDDKTKFKEPDEGSKIRDGGEEEDDNAGGKKDDDDKGADPGAGAGKSAIADDVEVEIQVNGKPVKMPWSEAKKKLQLAAATEQTLEDAKATREAANRELEAAAAARRVAEATGKPAGDGKDTKEPTPEEKVRAKVDAAEAAKDTAMDDYTKAVRYGTDDEIKDATAKLRKAEKELDAAKLEQVQASTAAPAQAQDALLEREMIDTNRAMTDYVEKYAEDQKDELFRMLVGSRLRKEMTADLTKMGADENLLAKLTDLEIGEHHLRARSRGLVRQLDKVLSAAGEQAREELKRRSGPTPGQDRRNERHQRKIDAPPPPAAAAGRTAEPEPDKPKTSKELVEEVKRRRGKA